DRRQGKAFVVTTDPVEVVVSRARIADHLPRDHVAVAPVDRVGKEAHLNVSDDLREERLAVGSFELDFSAFQTLQDEGLVVVRNVGERHTERALACSIQRSKAFTIFLGRALLRLMALVRCAGLKRRTQVESFLSSVGAGQLPVDEYGATGFLSAGRFGV